MEKKWFIGIDISKKTLDVVIYVPTYEAQNTTQAQMKMFLTRLGFNSKAVITGDLTQIDLPDGQKSGLKQAVHILRDVEGIGILRLGNKDVVRHPLVQRIVEAYEKYDTQAKEAATSVIPPERRKR